MAWDPKQAGATVQSDAAEATALGRQAQSPFPEPVSGSESRYRAEFSGTTHPDFDIVLGTGMSVANPGTATAHLDVSTGTTANQTATITCKKSFQPPFNTGFGFKISQKIANQEFYFDLVAENADGTLDTTVMASWRIAFADAAAATTARTETRNGGPAVFQSGNITVATETVDSVFEITVETDEIWFHSKPMQTSAIRTVSVAQQFVVPDPSRRYRPRLRINNLGSAPASNTVVSFYYLTVADYTEIKSEITGGNGSSGPGQGVPVNIMNAPTVNPAAGSTVVPVASASSTALNAAKINSTATTNATNLKTTAGRVYGWQLKNTGAAWVYVKLHNSAANPPVPGTTAVTEIIAIPPNGVSECIFTVPITYVTGIGFSITNLPADTDTTAVALNQVIGSLYWI